MTRTRTSAKQAGTRMTLRCVVCDSQIAPLDGRSWRAKYCSNECALASRRAKYAANPRPRKPRKSTAERLWSRVEKRESGCWEWTGFITRSGYGEMGVAGRSSGTILTHRAAWIDKFGPIPDGLFVCHACDNRACCNPDHLFLGTNEDNMRDMMSKGRGAKGFALPQTRLSEDDVRFAREHPQRINELAARFGVTTKYLRAVINGRERANVAQGMPQKAQSGQVVA